VERAAGLAEHEQRISLQTVFLALLEQCLAADAKGFGGAADL